MFGTSADLIVFGTIAVVILVLGVLMWLLGRDR